MHAFFAKLLPGHRACVVAIAGLLAAAVPHSLARGESQGRWGSFAIVNPTTRSITYDVRWGNGPWERFTLAPYEFLAHRHILDHRNYAPYRYIRFVYTTVGRPARCREYRLGFYQVRHAFRGKPYYFQYNRGGTLIDLYKVTNPRDERAWSRSVDDAIRKGTNRVRIPGAWLKPTS